MLQQQLASYEVRLEDKDTYIQRSTKPRTRLTDYQDRSRQYTLGKLIIYSNQLNTQTRSQQASSTP